MNFISLCHKTFNESQLDSINKKNFAFNFRPFRFLFEIIKNIQLALTNDSIEVKKIIFM